MSLDEATLNRQLGRANEDMAAWVKVLETNGVPRDNRRKDATWRKLNSACNTIRTRLKAVAALKSRDEQVAQHKVDKLTAAVAEKEPKKAGKEPKGGKAPKAAKEPKTAGKEKGGEKKGEGKKADKGTDAKEKKKKDKE